MPDVTKSRLHGFHDVVDSEAMFERLLRRCRRETSAPCCRRRSATMTDWATAQRHFERRQRTVVSFHQHLLCAPLSALALMPCAMNNDRIS